MIPRRGRRKPPVTCTSTAEALHACDADYVSCNFKFAVRMCVLQIRLSNRKCMNDRTFVAGDT